MSNSEIVFWVGVVIVVLIARKWDDFKWVFALALVCLALWTAWKMGMFNGILPEFSTPKVTW